MKVTNNGNPHIPPTRKGVSVYGGGGGAGGGAGGAGGGGGGSEKRSASPGNLNSCAQVSQKPIMLPRIIEII